MLVDLDEGAVNHDHAQVKLGVQGRKNGVKDAALDPAVEALVDGDPLAELRGKIAPGRSGAGDPENTLDGGTVVLGVGAATMPALAWEKRGNAFPLAV